jgi:hypothetical protein
MLLDGYFEIIPEEEKPPGRISIGPLAVSHLSLLNFFY